MRFSDHEEEEEIEKKQKNSCNNTNVNNKIYCNQHNDKKQGEKFNIQKKLNVKKIKNNEKKNLEMRQKSSRKFKKENVFLPLDLQLSRLSINSPGLDDDDDDHDVIFINNANYSADINNLPSKHQVEDLEQVS